jgi:hypothetical protein
MKEWVRRGVEMLGEMKVLMPNLAVRDFTKHYADGSTVRTQTIENEGTRVDVLNINVPFGGEVKIIEEHPRKLPYPIIELQDAAWGDVTAVYQAENFVTQLGPFPKYTDKFNSAGKIDSVFGEHSIKELTSEHYHHLAMKTIEENNSVTDDGNPTDTDTLYAWSDAITCSAPTPFKSVSDFPSSPWYSSYIYPIAYHTFNAGLLSDTNDNPNQWTFFNGYVGCRAGILDSPPPPPGSGTGKGINSDNARTTANYWCVAVNINNNIVRDWVDEIDIKQVDSPYTITSHNHQWMQAVYAPIEYGCTRESWTEGIDWSVLSGDWKKSQLVAPQGIWYGLLWGEIQQPYQSKTWYNDNYYCFFKRYGVYPIEDYNHYIYGYTSGEPGWPITIRIAFVSDRDQIIPIKDFTYDDSPYYVDDGHAWPVNEDDPAKDACYTFNFYNASTIWYGFVYKGKVHQLEIEGWSEDDWYIVMPATAVYISPTGVRSPVTLPSEMVGKYNQGGNRAGLYARTAERKVIEID